MIEPNTTPVPNELFDEFMRTMTPPEFLITCAVIRATFGWILDRETGMRKKEDWISTSQLMEKTGLSNKTISEALKSCIDKGYLEARDSGGELLDTPEKRAGKKIYFRVGKSFVSRYVKSTQVGSTYVVSEKTDVKSTSQPMYNLHATKETLTKENIQKGSSSNEEDSFEKMEREHEEYKKKNPDISRFKPTFLNEKEIIEK